MIERRPDRIGFTRRSTESGCASQQLHDGLIQGELFPPGQRSNVGFYLGLKATDGQLLETHSTTHYESP